MAYPFDVCLVSAGNDNTFLRGIKTILSAYPFDVCLVSAGDGKTSSAGILKSGNDEVDESRVFCFDQTEAEVDWIPGQKER